MPLRFDPTPAPQFGRGLPAPVAADMPTGFFHDIHPDVSHALLAFGFDPDDDFLTNAAFDDQNLNFPTNAAAAGFTGPPVVDDAAWFTGLPIAGDAAAAFLGPPEIKYEDANIVDQHFHKKPRAAAGFTCCPVVGDAAAAGFTGPPAVSDAAAAHLGPPAMIKHEDTGIVEQHFRKKPRVAAFNGHDQLPELPQQPPVAFARGSDESRPGRGNGNVHQAAQSAAARERRKRISQKTAELSRLIPGGHRQSTADMLQEAARYVRFLQAQIGVLKLIPSVESSSSKKGKMMPTNMATQEEMEMHALLVSRSVQQRLAAEGKCLMPRKMVDAMAKDKDVKSDRVLSRDLARFIASSLEKQTQ